MTKKRGPHSEKPAKARCLLVGFRSGPALALTSACPAAEFSMGNRNYRDQGFGDWTGFYDWLRVPSEKVVGVRYWPFDETRFLLQTLSNLPYVSVVADGACLEVYFTLRPRLDRSRSDDQAFGSNKVFYSEEGGWLLSFDTTGLSESELASLRTADVEWESVAAVGQSAGRATPALKPKKLSKAAGSA